MAGAAGAGAGDMSFFRRQMDMFRGFFRTMSDASNNQRNTGDLLNRAGNSLRRVLRNTTRSEMRQEFGNLGGDIRRYQQMLRRYNVQNEEDLERLTRIGARFYDNEDQVREMRDNFRQALDQMQDDQQRAADRMRSNVMMLGVGDIQGNVDSDATSITELSNLIKRSSGLSSDQMVGLREDLLKSMKDINKEAGFSLVNYKEVLENAKRFSEELHVADPEVLNKLAKDQTILENASKVSFMESGKALEKLNQRGFTDEMRKDFIDSFVNVTKGQLGDPDKIMNSVNTLSDAISTFSNGDKGVAAQMNKSIMRASVLFESAYLDSEPFMETFKQAVLENDPEAMTKLTTQLSQVGMSVSDAQNAFASGNFDNFAAEYVKSVGELFQKSSGHNRAALAEMYGIDSGQINKFMKASETSEEKMAELAKQMEEGAGATDQAAQQTKLWHERMLNWLSGISIFGTDLGTVVENIGANPLQAYAAIMIAKDAFGGIGKAGGWVIDKFKKLGGGTGSSGGILGRIGANLVTYGGYLKTGGLAVLSFAGSITKSAITALVSFATTIWTTVIPALVAMAKSAWSSMAGRFGWGGRGRGGRGGGGRGGGGGGRPPIPPVPPPGGGAMNAASKWAGRAGLAGTLAFGAYNIATSDDKSKAIAETAGSALGGWGGAAAGAAVGAAIGSVVPILGTAVGGAIGGIIGGIGGGMGGGWLGGKINEWFGGDDAKNAEKEANKAAESAYLDGADMGIPSYDVGTNFVPQDGLAYVHQGEAIIPADLNNPVPIDDMSSIRASADQISKSSTLEKKLEERHRAAETQDRYDFDAESIVDAVNKLTAFMKYWHQDELERDRRKDRREDPFALQRQTVTNWGG